MEKRFQLKTYMPPQDEIEKKWYVIDASGKVLGRLASRIAQILRGKHKPQFTPHLDTGDHVIVVNAEKVMLTGKKASFKKYAHHTGYPGGLKEEKFADLLKQKPERIIELAVKGMLPHNRLGRRLFTKLKVYAGDQHPHAAQRPETLVVK
jgi:large subunit ribosomal protein L13